MMLMVTMMVVEMTILVLMDGGGIDGGGYL